MTTLVAIMLAVDAARRARQLGRGVLYAAAWFNVSLGCALQMGWL